MPRLQHLAAMTNDINLAKYVNLLKSNDEDIPFTKKCLKKLLMI